MISLLLVFLLGLVGFAGVDATVPAPSPDEPLEDVPPRGSLERVDASRVGGIAYQELKATITDPDDLARLAELLPDPLPTISDPQGVCADCYAWRIVLDYRGAAEAVVIEFDQSNAPEELGPFVGALDDHLE